MVKAERQDQYNISPSFKIVRQAFKLVTKGAS